VAHTNTYSGFGGGFMVKTPGSCISEVADSNPYERITIKDLYSQPRVSGALWRHNKQTRAPQHRTPATWCQSFNCLAKLHVGELSKFQINRRVKTFSYSVTMCDNCDCFVQPKLACSESTPSSCGSSKPKGMCKEDYVKMRTDRGCPIRKYKLKAHTVNMFYLWMSEGEWDVCRKLWQLLILGWLRLAKSCL